MQTKKFFSDFIYYLLGKRNYSIFAWSGFYFELTFFTISYIIVFRKRGKIMELTEMVCIHVLFLRYNSVNTADFQI